MQYLEPILSLAGQHPEFVFLTVFLAAFAESLALVGLVVPGGIVVFACGAAAAMGHLAPLPVLLLAVAGAACGDGLSYWLGCQYSTRLRRPLSHEPLARSLRIMLAKGEAFFLRYGGKSVFLGRFSGMTRPMVPMVAGMKAMRPVSFFTASLPAAVGWGLLYVVSGALFATFLLVLDSISARLAILLLLLGGSVWAFFWLCRRGLFVATLFGRRWLVALRRWAVGRPSRHDLVRLGQGLVARLFSLGVGAGLLAAFLGILLIAAVGGFAAVVQDVLAKDRLVAMDQSVDHFFSGLRTTWTDTLFVAITELGDPFVTTTLVIAILGVLLALRLRRTALFWLLTAVGGSLGMQVLKWFFRLPRPTNLYEGISSYSFPSGHTTMSVVLYGFFAVLLARRLTGLRRWLLFAAVGLIAFLIGFSRLYLGAHWFSDVLAGSLIGASWVALMGIAWLEGTDERIPGKWLLLTVLVVLCTAGSWHILQRHGRDMRLYTPQPLAQNLALAAWRDGAWQQLPAARVDVAGGKQQPLSVQWAGQREEIRRLLIDQGWQEAPSPGLRNILALLVPRAPITELPVLPLLHEGREEGLLMVRNHGHRRQVLRLWVAANITIAPGNAPLFVGFLEEQRSGTLGGLPSFPTASGRHDQGHRSLLAREVDGAVLLNEVRRTGPHPASDGEKRKSEGQAAVLLLWHGGATP